MIPTTLSLWREGGRKFCGWEEGNFASRGWYEESAAAEAVRLATAPDNIVLPLNYPPLSALPPPKYFSLLLSLMRENEYKCLGMKVDLFVFPTFCHPEAKDLIFILELNS